MNIFKTIACSCLLSGFSLTLAAQSVPKASYDVVPLPKQVTLQQQWGDFTLTPATRIVCGKSKADQENAKSCKSLWQIAQDYFVHRNKTWKDTCYCVEQ